VREKALVQGSYRRNHPVNGKLMHWV